MAMIGQAGSFLETVEAGRRQMAPYPEELAHALGVSFTTVNRWENRRRCRRKRAHRRFQQFCKSKKIGILHTRRTMGIIKES